MKKIMIILLSVIVYYACNNDDHVVKPEVAFSEFTDPRDMKVYKCVTIGEQTWMAENLKYRLPLGSIDGCYTFKEGAVREYDAKVSVELFTDSMNAAMERGELSERYNDNFSVGDLLKAYVVNYQMPVSQAISMVERTCEVTCPNGVKAIKRMYNNLLPFALAELVENNLKDTEAKNGNYSSVNGFLYSYDGAVKAVPEGWRLPTDEDWKKLEENLGMSLSELDKLDVWRGGEEGRLLKAGKDGCGFDALFSGARVFGTFMYGTNFINKGSRAYFWSSSKVVENDTINHGIIRLLSMENDQIMRGTSDLTAAYSVRCIKE
ncbi:MULTISPECIES: FISUMP domain-containing protein [Butyricimonas]|uniref:FISUMP domain-containing protein n=1 Tax=Butyricimonas TaxID=574697 RepID=UPI001D064C84|nr:MULTISPECIES: FISUMP domain-containing protein [Butyricimonas]MCB6970838.1 hypothetical protein [Butyricimonas synergistica]MCG4517552.1 hypothetical protein [Butyricimonas sp. DFI.6.44]